MAFRKILCPVDFSAGSQQALRTAVRLANADDAELILAHSWYIPPVTLGGDQVYAGDIVQLMSDDAQRGLDEAVRDARELGARRVVSKMVNGAPWREIVNLAQREPGLDLLVIGTHGRSGLSRVLMGSVTELVVRHAPCPVLTVRPANDPTPYTHVLCPVDLSRPAHDAVKLAAELVTPGARATELVKPGTAGITVLHVLELPVPHAGSLPIPDFHHALDARAAALLDRWTAELAAKVSVPVRQLTRVGHPGAEILSLLEHDHSFDLVAMGGHGYTGIERLLLGSVAEKVVRHAACPVLVAHSAKPAT